ncbi:MAG TPA: acetamidase/formamidase family protein [Bryobacteraceae bacterium]|nr:acetamidase/formamidase family protein [Bryobacteraceae bacterium]
MFTSRAALLLLVSLPVSAQAPARHRLESTPKTVVWGYYDASIKPVLHIRSGDLVEIQTAMIASPEMLEGAGLPASQVDSVAREIHRTITDRGPGPHILTGPIYIESAEPGDVLQVEIRSIDLVLPYALNLFVPGSGTLPEDFPYARGKIIPLDREKMVARFAPGIEIPLHPFFGSMGVAPPIELGRVNSAPPWIHAGNLDNKDLVAGTTLFIPVHARGALFSIGDAHAGQGNGEVDLAALETVLKGTFRFVVRKDLRLRWPRAETPSHYMTMGFDEDLLQAAKIAVRDMVDFLSAEKHLSRDDAYMLASVAADLSVTQLVDGKKGIHALIPKSLFTASK